VTEDETIFTPLDFVRYVAENRKVPVDTIKVPQRLLMTYQRHMYEYGKKLIDGKSVDWWMYGESQPFCIGQFNNVEIGLGRFWVGAPAAVMTLEELIACGAKTVFEVAKYRNVEAASAQVVSDVLSETGWLQAFGHQQVREKGRILVKAVLEALSEAQKFNNV